MTSVTTFTSLLLIFPAIYAYGHGLIDVFVASMICAMTSFLHHGNNCKDHGLAIIDRTAVRLISMVYILHAILFLGSSLHVLSLLLFGVVTGALYVRYALLQDTEDVHDMHALIHVFAMVGMIQYVNARKWAI